MKHEDLLKRKRELRVELLANLGSQGNTQESSRRIVERLLALPEFLAAKTVCVYVSTAAEVQTHGFIERCWEQRKRVAVPYCLQGELHLFRLDAMRELAPRTLGILEPRAELHRNTERRICPAQVDVFIVPGVGFDRAGGRLRHGKGYYDRLLGRAAPTAHKIGLAFECQVMPQVPMDPNDVFLNGVITDCFIRSDDDCVALKGLDFQAANSKVERITIENCILWCDRARIFLLGHESRAEYMREVTLRNLDIIHFSMTPFLFEPGEDMRLEGVRIEDVRLYGEGQRELIRLRPVVNQYMRKQVPGFIRNVHFTNIAVEGAEGEYRIQLIGADAEHDIRQVTFENVSVLGNGLTPDSPYLTCGDHVQDVRFDSSP